MRIQTEYMSFNNRWMISSSYDCQAHQWRSQRRWCFSQTALLWFKVLPDKLPALRSLLPVLPGAPRFVVSAARLVVGASGLVVGPLKLVPGAHSDSVRRQECPPRVCYCPEIDASNFTLHILSDTPGGSQWLKYILLMLILAGYVWLDCRMPSLTG